MNRSALFFVLVICGLLSGVAQKAHASDLVFLSGVTFDIQGGTVGGLSGTYASYDILDYYDPWVRGELYYTNPYEFLDWDRDEGVNSSYLGFPGITVDFTTSNYKTNQLLCTFSDHRLRLLYQQVPLFFDPYQISSIDPQTYEKEYTLEIPGIFQSNNFAPLPLYPVGFSWICVETPTVESVNFETINSPVTNNNPAFAGGDSRIFPDRDTPGDLSNRRIVRVRAEINGNVQGVPVYFNNFDVDDPSSDSIIDPNGNTGNDNRGERDAQGNWTPQSAGTLSGGSQSCPSVNGMLCRRTDSNGEAIIEFTVTKQPGDNFMVAASTDPNYLNGVAVSGTGLQDSTGSQIQTSSGRARRTKLLAVWRRLHIEVDSMGYAQQNFIAGTIPNEMEIRPLQTVTITLTPSPQGGLEPNRFQGGRLVLGNVSLPVTCDLAMGETCNTDYSVTVRNSTQSTVYFPANSQFQLYDDDDFNNDDGIYVDGDTQPLPGENITMPSLCLIQGASMPMTCPNGGNSDDPTKNILAPAYIHPIYDIGDDNDYTVFASNVSADSGPAVRDLFDFDQIETEDSEDFWTAYLLGGYQYTIQTDEDPETESNDSVVGVTDAQNGVGSIVFMETNGPKECNSNVIFCNIAATAAHELGHLLNATDNDGGIMSDQSLSFSPISLNRIRYVPHP